MPHLWMKHVAFWVALYVLCWASSASSATSVGIAEAQACPPLRAFFGGALEETEANGIIEEFLAKSPAKLSDFYIQGWRWHTMSLVRETKRLHHMALRYQEDDSMRPRDNLKAAVQYVVGFNLKGLHKIEADLFFPWMRQKLTSDDMEPGLSSAFAGVMDQLERTRVLAADLGEQISRTTELYARPKASSTERAQALESVVRNTQDLHKCAKSMMQIENDILVPAIAEVVPASEQKSFNTKVLMNLGIWDSRLHLVGMHEAIADDDQERAIFKRAIPSIPQMMIPRWKRILYDPKAALLNS